MTDRRRNAGPWLIAAAVACLGALGFLLLWTTLMVYDDEGYVLYSLQAFADHGHLYRTVYSQYGPFFFTLFRGLHAVGLAFTNDTGRAIALVCWLGAATLCAGIVWRATGRQLLAAIATLVGVFLHLSVMSNEPSHPGGLIVLLVALAAWTGTHLTWTSTRKAAVLGAIGMALVLTKINVGLLLFIGAGAWWLVASAEASAVAAPRILAGLGLAVTPIALMWTSRHEPWIPPYMVVAAAGGVSVALAAGGLRTTMAPRRDALAAAIAAVAVAVLTIGTIVATGTSTREILDGVVLGPLRHPTVYWVPLHWRAGVVPLAFVFVALAAVLGRLDRERRTIAVVAGRVVVFVAYVLSLAGWIPVTPPALILCYGIASAGLFVLPFHANDATAGDRAFLALLLVTQSLHAYPVAGSQVSWGTFLWVPLAVLALVDLGAIVTSPLTFRLAGLAAAIGMILLAGDNAVAAITRFRSSDLLDLPGARHVRVPESLSSAIRMLARNAQVHSDMLFTLPGMMSFNHWTALPPPTVANATHWFNLLDSDQQDAIQRRLEADPRSVVIVQRYVYDLLDRQHFLHETPLLRYLHDNYSTVFRVQTYEFQARKDRAIVPVDSVRLYAASAGTSPRYKLEIVLAPRAPVTVARIELRRFAGDVTVPVVSWRNDDAVLTTIPLTETGSPAGSPVAARLPVAIHGVVSLNLFTNVLPEPLDQRNGVVRLYDESGRRIAEARFID